MIYTLPNKEQLPTISQVLAMVRDLTSQMPVRHRMPYDEPVEDDGAFLLNRTASGLFTLKPNITRQPCLYFGDNDYHRMLQPRWNELKSEDWLIQNVLREEFELTMLSHPLYRLLLNGIPTRKAPVRVINPFGNAMSYGFPSPMMPLTSSLDAAAFFATHKRDNQTGVWTAITEIDEKGDVNVGVLYMMELALPFPMIPGLSCIGMQAFERPGRQRLFGLNMNAGENFNQHRFVTGFQFRQNPDDVRELTEMFANGNLLTPNELIAQKADDILKERRISESAFGLNCRNNPRGNAVENRKRIIAAGIKIEKLPVHEFTEDELAREYYPTAAEQWNNMFGQVVAVHPGFDRLLEDIRNFPNTDEGRRYFRR